LVPLKKRHSISKRETSLFAEAALEELERILKVNDAAWFFHFTTTIAIALSRPIVKLRADCS